MSLTASLTQELGAVRAAAERTADATEKGGERMVRALRRTNAQARQVNTSLTTMERQIQRAGRGALAAFGLGSVTMAATSAVRLIQNMMREADQRSRENMESATGFATGTRDPRIADQPAFQAALRSGGGTLPQDQLIAVGRAIATQGVTDAATVATIARIASDRASRALGLDPAAFAGAMATAAARGSDRPGDLVGAMLTRTGGNLSEAQQIIAGMTHLMARRQGPEGALSGFLGSRTAAPMSIEAVRRESLTAIADRPDDAAAANRANRERRDAARRLRGEDIVNALRSGDASMEDLNAFQLQELAGQAYRAAGQRAMPYMLRSTMRNASLEMSRRLLNQQPEFQEFMEVQRVQIVPTTEVIGDDQP